MSVSGQVDPPGSFPPSRSGGAAPQGVELRHPLTARAGLVWNVDLPRQLQQVLVDTTMAASFGE